MNDILWANPWFYILMVPYLTVCLIVFKLFIEKAFSKSNIYLFGFFCGANGQLIVEIAKILNQFNP
jgi:hypothetical protein